MGFCELALTLINFNMLVSSLAFLRNIVASIPTIADLKRGCLSSLNTCIHQDFRGEKMYIRSRLLT